MLPSPMVAPDQDSSLWYLLIPFQIKSSKRNIPRSLNLPWPAICPWLSSKMISRGTSLVIQCLRPWAPSAGGPGSITSQGNRSHMPQRSQINNFLKNISGPSLCAQDSGPLLCCLHSPEWLPLGWSHITPLDPRKLMASQEPWVGFLWSCYVISNERKTGSLWSC